MVKKYVKQASKTRDRIISVTFLVVAVILIDLTPFGGNIRYYIKWAQCGQRPVQTQSMPGIAWYENTTPYPTLLRDTSWYCTATEAERAGYSASQNSWIFPNLEK